MKATVVLVAVCLLAMGATAATPPTNMVMHSYAFRPALLDVVEKGGFTTFGSDPAAAKTLQDNLARKADRDDKETAKLLEGCGVRFPPGAWVRYVAALNRLFMFNTEDNHAILAAVLKSFGPRQVVVDYAWIEMPLADIEAAARAAPEVFPDDATLLSLWKAGKGHLMNASRLVTRTGQAATDQGVSEIIYPTEFQFLERGSNAVERADAVAPGAFETRPVGAIMNLTPTVGPDNDTLDLALSPELAELIGWSDEWSSRSSVSSPQPLFHSDNITTTLSIKSGQTVVLGGLRSHDGSQQRYLVLRARVVDAEFQACEPWSFLEQQMTPDAP
jgi:hypothetical protein